MDYDVYAGGFHVVSSHLTIDMVQKNGYMLRLAAYTHGMLAKLAPWKGVFQTEGWYDEKNKTALPQKHFSNTTWRNESELTEFFYNKNRSFKGYRITDKKGARNEEKDKGLTDGTTDVLTATLTVMNKVADGGKCEGRDEIFDGDRRYALIYHPAGTVELKQSKLNVYAGPATECTVEVKPIAGKWHSKPRGWLSIQEQGRAKGTMPTIWLAQLSEGAAAVPVRIRVKTDYGTLFMHLTRYQGGENRLSLKK